MATVAALPKQGGGQSEVQSHARAGDVQIAELEATQHFIAVACLLVQPGGPGEVLVDPLAGGVRCSKLDTALHEIALAGL